jgi:hypothetical protein
MLVGAKNHVNPRSFLKDDLSIFSSEATTYRYLKLWVFFL